MKKDYVERQGQEQEEEEEEEEDDDDDDDALGLLHSSQSLRS